MLRTCRDVPGAWGELEELTALGDGHSHAGGRWDLGGALGSLGSPSSRVLQMLDPAPRRRDAQEDGGDRVAPAAQTTLVTSWVRSAGTDPGDTGHRVPVTYV